MQLEDVETVHEAIESMTVCGGGKLEVQRASEVTDT